jgi:Zn-dependent protease with chaperone function
MNRKHLILFTSLTILVFAGFLYHSETVKANIKTETIRGYITEVHSPTVFEIEEHRIKLEGTYEVDLRNVPDRAMKFDPEQHIRVGTLIRIRYDVNRTTGEVVQIRKVTLDVQQFRERSHTVVLQETPTDLVRGSDGSWTGSVIADGRRVVINPSTLVRFKLNKSEKKAQKKGKKGEEPVEEEVTEVEPDDTEEAEDSDDPDTDDPKENEADNEADDEDEEGQDGNSSRTRNRSNDDDFGDEFDIDDLLKDSLPLTSLVDIKAGIYMTYHGREDISGRVIARQVVFVKNEKSKEEERLWKQVRMKVKESKKPNAFTSMQVGKTKYKVLPDEQVQKYVDRLGYSLVPEYQRRLPDGDENKIPFVFRVVHSKGFNAGAYPTGTVVINHEVFETLENEAQLAFLLSHEIAHATQEHTLRKALKDRKTRTGLTIARIAAYSMGYGLIGDVLTLTQAAMVSGYNRSLENQSDRIALDMMVRNGYDPREAPRTWKAVAMRYGAGRTNLFWSNHSSNIERRSYLMLVIRNTYPDVDFSSMKRDSEEFHQVASYIGEKYPSKGNSKR